ncbi:MAG: peptidase [Bdellovibrionales bacterium]|nr:peptidase [Bdellovibrionales bacterium]
MKKKKTKTATTSYDEKIIIDEKNGLVFDSEDDVLKYFEKDISALEKQYLSLRPKDDYTDEESAKLEKYLDQTLDNPDEIWVDSKTIKNRTVHLYLKLIEAPKKDFYYVAIVFAAEDVPTFIFLHFPTKHLEILEKYRRGELFYDRIMSEVEQGCVEGDALSEGDELAIGLYKAMLVIRSEDDVAQTEFQTYSELREETIEEPDEIWRNNDLAGNTLVNFIKDFSISGEQMYYVVVTLEDSNSNSHALLFSFPTHDESLVERYRHGENMQAEEVVQESSH